MQYIDPHIHMISRVTDDYERLAQAGYVAVSEPAFWAGYDRGSAAAFHDYFRHLTDVEPKRAAQYGIRHFCWLCINAKEAENVTLSREVIAQIPEFLDRPGVLGIGEIGLNKNTPNESRIFLEQLDLAARLGGQIVQIVHDPTSSHRARGGESRRDGEEERYTDVYIGARRGTIAGSHLGAEERAEERP